MVDLTAESATSVRILVDGSLVEAFVEDRQAITVRGFPTADSGWQVEAADADLSGWRLGLPETS